MTAAALAARRAIYTDILHFCARVLVIQTIRGLLTASDPEPDTVLPISLCDVRSPVLPASSPDA